MLQKKRGRQLASTGAEAKRLPAVPGWAFACSQQSMRIAALQEEYSGLAGPIKLGPLVEKHYEIKCALSNLW
jgi:hypothetical protein